MQLNGFKIHHDYKYIYIKEVAERKYSHYAIHFKMNFCEKCLNVNHFVITFTGHGVDKYAHKWAVSLQPERMELNPGQYFWIWFSNLWFWIV